MFASWLTEELTKRKMTQSELSRRTGMSRGTISHIIIGKRKPEPQTCSRIAQALQLPLDLVMIKAGHLPATNQISSDNPFIAEISLLFTKLSTNDQRQIVDIVRTFDSRIHWSE